MSSILQLLQSIAPPQSGGALSGASKSDTFLSDAEAPTFGELLQSEQSDIEASSGGLSVEASELSTPLESEPWSEEELSEALTALEQALESMDEEALLALGNVLFALESMGPIGVRVASAGQSGAALPVEAEQVWAQLLESLRLWLQPSAASASVQLESTSATPAPDAILPLLEKIAALAQAEPTTAQAQSSDAPDAKQLGKETLLENKSAKPESSALLVKDVSEASSKSVSGELSPSGSDKSSQDVAPVGEKLEKVPEFSKVQMSIESEEESTEEPKLKVSVSKEAARKENTRVSSAVVVLAESADRLRSRLLSTLDRLLPKPQSTSTQGQGGALSWDESWNEMRAWLTKSVESAAKGLEALGSKLSSADALQFLKFVQNHKKMGWGAAPQTVEDGVEADGKAAEAKSADGKKAETELKAGEALVEKRRSLESAGPMLRRAAPWVAQRFASPELMAVGERGHEQELARVEAKSDTTEVRVTDPATGAEKVVRVEREPGMVDSMSQRVGEPERVAKEAQVQQDWTSRFDRDTMEKVLAQTRQHLKLWLDKKLVAMQVQLEPADLGKIQMRTVLESGRIGVLLQVENGAAKELLQQQIQQLREVLEAQGLEVAGFYVEIWEQHQRDAQEGQKNFSGTPFDMDRLLGEDGVEEASSPVPKRGLIDQVV